MKHWIVVFVVFAVAGAIACSKKDGGSAAGGGAAGSSAAGGSAEGSQGSAAEAAAAVAVAETDTPAFKALEKNVTINQLSHEAKKTDPATWPKDDVADLDFTLETGNAVLVLRKTGGELDEILVNAPKFQLFHAEDDPSLIARYANGIGLPEGDTKATYQDKRFAPALATAARAKYAMLLTTELTRPDLDMGNGKKFTPGAVKGRGVLYELESQKLLGGIEFIGTNSDEVMVVKGNTSDHPRKLVHDLERNTREALRKAVIARFPSAKVPTWTYYEPN